jgi:hypothetical protein
LKNGHLDRSISRMNKLIQMVALLLFIAMMTGCASPYLINRGRDAADVFTATVGYGVGAKARVGPVQAALFANRDMAGLRAGSGFLGNDHSGEVYAPIPISYKSDWGVNCGGEWFSSLEFVEERRKKDIFAISRFPLLVFAEHPHFYTQAEIAVGLGPSIRLGFNAGELLDFILGWTTIDIFKDDIE